MIPSVAASERGRAQTGQHVKACTLCAAGVAGFQIKKGAVFFEELPIYLLAEQSGKTDHRW